MNVYAQFAPGRLPWRTIGRVGLALLGGGAFAALAWEPSPARSSPNPEVAGAVDQATAARQSIVKEDGASPHFDAHQARPYTQGQWGLRNEERWGLAGVQIRIQPWTAGSCGAEATAGQHVGGQVPTNQTMTAKTAATTGVNSRGPP